uniref:Uncharacterized protein n=1 Tax=Rhizophora mucronata TaxID=61149 RepID=A0A2P2PMC7_RHIMU
MASNLFHCGVVLDSCFIEYGEVRSPL